MKDFLSQNNKSKNPLEKSYQQAVSVPQIHLGTVTRKPTHAACNSGTPTCLGKPAMWTLEFGVPGAEVTSVGHRSAFTVLAGCIASGSVRRWGCHGGRVERGRLLSWIQEAERQREESSARCNQDNTFPVTSVLLPSPAPRMSPQILNPSVDYVRAFMV